MFAVRLYRWTVSPAQVFLFGPGCGCRFEPSCSAYALEALRMHGALAGSWLTVRRVCRCHPWGACGHDPVPEKQNALRTTRSETAPRQTLSADCPLDARCSALGR